MLQTKDIDEIKTLILLSILFFSEIRAVYETMWATFGRARQVKDNSIIRRMPPG